MKGTTFLVMGLIIGVALASNPLVVIGDKYLVYHTAKNTFLTHPHWHSTWPKMSK